MTLAAPSTFLREVFSDTELGFLARPASRAA